MKLLCQFILCLFMSLGGFGSLLWADTVDSGVIMQYHHVSTSTPQSTSISPQLFLQHMDYLVEENFVLISLPELSQHLKQQTTLAPKTVGISFDDAYLDIYTTAYPMLKQRNFPFTIFVATALVGKKNYLNWAQLREMQAHGATIANHSHSHLHLVRTQTNETHQAWLDRISNDILRAEKIIQRETGKTSKLFAYPYGEYNRQVLQLIDSLGYVGFGQQSGAAGIYDQPSLYPRFPFSGAYAAMASVKTKLNTLAMPLNQIFVRPVIEANQPNAPVLTLDFRHSQLPLHQLSCYGPKGKMPLTTATPRLISVQARYELPAGRSRYNCTLPAYSQGQFYWFSQIWMKKQADGSWYPEP